MGKSAEPTCWRGATLTAARLLDVRPMQLSAAHPAWSTASTQPAAAPASRHAAAEATQWGVGWPQPQQIAFVNLLWRRSGAAKPWWLQRAREQRERARTYICIVSAAIKCGSAQPVLAGLANIQSLRGHEAGWRETGSTSLPPIGGMTGGVQAGGQAGGKQGR